ncbi:hypothetical protein [Bradyrhizobium sp. ARR65]|uniref:hypothetical protein n=1 Tax=Bradyrhizobium sp. ARR65 TaxID=1040989 RepID=UPI001FDA0E7E|nr:hypothetical protein [Bradyrhizobium sp. ARR65]
MAAYSIATACYGFVAHFSLKQLGKLMAPAIEKPMAKSPDRCLSTIARPYLPKDCFNMSLYGWLSDFEKSRNMLVGFAQDDPRKDCDFPRRQLPYCLRSVLDFPRRFTLDRRRHL